LPGHPEQRRWTGVLAGHVPGVAVVLSATTFLYTFRKRSRVSRGPKATMMTWFKAHIWLGLLAFGVVRAATRWCGRSRSTCRPASSH
jgi:hypothetical protein